ncbi:hypothetical protein, partial [Vallitalea sp.]|uniref:hypothetical protein n=1 Tax=Vallitalea sp. TaxID=1882829 RepID=UPI0025FF8EBE
KIDKLNLRRRTDGTEFLFFNVILGDVYDAELILVGYDFEENRWITNNEKKLIAAFALIPGSANVAKKIGGEVIERIAKKGVAEEIIEEVSKETMEEIIEETSEEVVEKVVKETTGNLVEVTAGKNFKDHFIRHKGLLQEITGKKYSKYKTHGQEFLDDIGKIINDGTVKFEGMGTIKKGFPADRIYRGNGVTLILKESGELRTILKSGEGMDLGIKMIK